MSGNLDGYARTAGHDRRGTVSTTMLPRLRRAGARWRVPAVAATVGVMLLAFGAMTAYAVTDDPTSNPCVSNSSGTISVSQRSLALGQSTTLTWHLDKAPNCTIVPRLMFRDRVAGYRFTVQSSGPTVTPPASGSYVLAVSSLGFTYDMAETPVINVTLPVVNGHPLASITRGGDQAATFAQGATTPNAVVAVRGDVDLDLSYGRTIVVAPGVQIIGQRDAAHPSGPRLYTTTFQRPVLGVGDESLPSDNVRITGIRFDGGEPTDPCDVAGTTTDTDAIDVFSSQGVKIDHNEFYRWSGTAVEVRDPHDDRINPDNSETVWIHDNYFHDNQHPTYCGTDPWASLHGGGYGVGVNAGGYPKIEHNVFSANRHAIAANQAEGDGYNLVGNLFLAPGIDNVKLGWTNYNHHIDAHGRDTCPDINNEHFNCGPAGLSYSVGYNTVVGWYGSPNDGDAIQLRGIPTRYQQVDRVGMQVFGNVFAQGHDHALTQTQVGLVDAGDNAFNVDLSRFWNTTSNAPCDFDGDHAADPFRASGASWWYYSTRAHRWVALDTTTATDPTFSDSNRDGLCDVSRGTTRYTKPWLETFSGLTTRAPNLTGTTQAAATASLATAGLVLGTVTSVANTAAAGTIVSATPAANAAVAVGTAVDIAVSTGQAPVPNVRNMDYYDAMNTIRAAGFTVGNVTTTNVYTDAADNTVQSQYPVGGTSVAAGSAVNIVVGVRVGGGDGGGGDDGPPPSCARTCE